MARVEVPVLEEARDPERVALARTLFEEHSRGLGFPLDFDGFAQELESLPGEYAPPHGRLILARVGEQYAGGVALRRLDAAICELKRFYVRPDFRGRGIGGRLARRGVREGRRLGYRRRRLDTIPAMTVALGIYRSLGFREIPPYRFNPIQGAVYLELDLGASPRPPARGEKRPGGRPGAKR